MSIPSLPVPAAIDAWRVFRILSEFVEGFETMTGIGALGCHFRVI